MRILGFIWLIFIVMLSGCATIMDGSKQSVTIESSPDGASVYINDELKGVTPLTIEIKRDDNTILKVSKDGYEEVSEKLVTALNGKFWGNIIFGGFLGSTTDASTGASREYVPNVYMVTLPEKNIQ